MPIVSAVHNQRLATFAHVAQEKATQVENHWKLYDQGVFQLSSQQHQETLLLFDQAIAIASLQPEVWYACGDALAELANYLAPLPVLTGRSNLTQSNPMPEYLGGLF